MGLFQSSHVASVQVNQEMRRIERLPRRSWDPDELEELRREMTAILKQPHGQQVLRPIQAAALYEIGTAGGLFAPIRVGAGKTLISLLAPVVSEGVERPLLLIPAKLRVKTEKAMVELRSHWRLPRHIRVMTYDWLGREQADEALLKYAPDQIICDEGHKLKNRTGAAVARRFARYMKEHPDTRVIVMSGTVTKRSVLDYAHLLWYCLKDNCPVPGNWHDLELWADALDERKGQVKRANPAGLRVLCNEEEDALWEDSPRRAARLAYKRRLIETPGVITTTETDIDASIVISAVEPPRSTKVEDAFDTLRTWETPDGHPIADGLGMYRHAREIALGFYYVWNPRPPIDWLVARKEWYSKARSILSRSRTWDSEGQLRKAMLDPDEDRLDVPDELAAWLAIENTFTPNLEIRWIDDSALQLAANWLDEYRGLCWVEHALFGIELASITGLPYYRQAGVDELTGANIEDHPRGAPMILSIESNLEGRNLQAWDKNLILSPVPNALRQEQLMGRTHRDGQEADEVTFDIAAFCVEHIAAFWQCMKDARYTEDTIGSPQKLLISDHDFPDVYEVAQRGGSRWDKGQS